MSKKLNDQIDVRIDTKLRDNFKKILKGKKMSKVLRQYIRKVVQKNETL